MCKWFQFPLEEGRGEIYSSSWWCSHRLLSFFFLPITHIPFIQEALGLETELDLITGWRAKALHCDHAVSSLSDLEILPPPRPPTNFTDTIWLLIYFRFQSWGPRRFRSYSFHPKFEKCIVKEYSTASQSTIIVVLSRLEMKMHFIIPWGSQDLGVARPSCTT